MPARKAGSEPTIHLLRKRLRDVMRAKSSFHMRDWHPGMKRCERGSQSRRCISLDNHDTWFLAGENGAKPGADPVHDLQRMLVRTHHVQVIIGMNAEYIQDLIQHLAMLRGHRYARIQRSLFAQMVDERRKLDGFRPCA